MEEIARRDGKYFYGEKECQNADEAYRLFRRDYNIAQGRNSYGFLQRLGRRRERVHGSGFVYTPEVKLRVFPPDRIKGYRLGLIANESYAMIVGMHDIPYELQEDDIEDWVDWIFRSGGKELKMMGNKKGTGRAAKKKKLINR